MLSGEPMREGPGAGFRRPSVTPHRWRGVRGEWLRSTVPGVDYAATVMLLGLRLQR
jgi:hypothetical protein